MSALMTAMSIGFAAARTGEFRIWNGLPDCSGLSPGFGNKSLTEDCFSGCHILDSDRCDEEDGWSVALNPDPSGTPLRVWSNNHCHGSYLLYGVDECGILPKGSSMHFAGDRFKLVSVQGAGKVGGYQVYNEANWCGTSKTPMQILQEGVCTLVSGTNDVYVRLLVSSGQFPYAVHYTSDCSDAGNHFDVDICGFFSGEESHGIKFGAYSSLQSTSACDVTECTGWSLKSCVEAHPDCIDQCIAACPDKCSGCACGSTDCNAWVCEACLPECEYTVCDQRDVCCPSAHDMPAFMVV